MSSDQIKAYIGFVKPGISIDDVNRFYEAAASFTSTGSDAKALSAMFGVSQSVFLRIARSVRDITQSSSQQSQPHAVQPRLSVFSVPSPGQPSIDNRRSSPVLPLSIQRTNQYQVPIRANHSNSSVNSLTSSFSATSLNSAPVGPIARRDYVSAVPLSTVPLIHQLVSDSWLSKYTDPTVLRLTEALNGSFTSRQSRQGGPMKMRKGMKSATSYTGEKHTKFISALMRDKRVPARVIRKTHESLGSLYPTDMRNSEELSEKERVRHWSVVAQTAELLLNEEEHRLSSAEEEKLSNMLQHAKIDLGLD